MISVVLPTFNRANRLVRAVECVLGQTHHDLELILVDDGSTDETPNIVRTFEDRRLRYIRLPSNVGQAAARNIGIREAAGAFVAFQDSDDIWLPHKLELQLKVLNNQESVIGVYCDLMRIPKAGEPYVIATPEPVLGAIANRKTRHYQTYGIGIQSCLFRTEPLRASGGFWEDLRAFEDLELLLRLVQLNRICRLPMPLVHYFQTGGVSYNSVNRWNARRLILRRYAARLIFSSPLTFLSELNAIRRHQNRRRRLHRSENAKGAA